MPEKQQISLWERFVNDNTLSGMFLSTLIYYRHFHHLHALLKKSQWWTKEQLVEYQNERLKKLITHAYTNVPYYRRSLNTVGLLPSAIRTVYDLYKIPFLTKEQIRNNSDDFKARNYPHYSFESMSTSGTTGDPLTLYVEKGKSSASLLAFYLQTFEHAQCRLTNRYLLIMQSDEFWKKEVFGRILILSPYSLRDGNVQILFEKIKKINPQYIIGFPSAISLLGHLMITKGDNLFNDLQAVFCSGETLYEWQRKFLERIFRCKIFSFYIQSEQVIFATNCEYTHSYHVFPEYGVTELIDKDGQVITQEGKKGEIVGTGFTNDIFPFIRYRTGDIGVYTNHLCSCGRQYPLLKKIEGRTQDFIVNKMGNELPMTGMHDVVPSSSNLIKEYQFFQRAPGDIVLRIVREKGFSENAEQLILQRLTRRLGPGFQFSIEYVDSVKRTPAGKVQFLVKSG
jgi:phenylacetate-CoA ligase